MAALSQKRPTKFLDHRGLSDKNVFISAPPRGLEKEFETLVTSDAIEFLTDLVLTFDEKVELLYSTRLGRRYNLSKNPRIPKFKKSAINRTSWKVSPVNGRLCNRRIDLGDVSPANIDHFRRALCADVQGIQVDFDDGHCPTWRNQITGLHNVYRCVHGLIPNVPAISKSPILMLRPRAWNIIEHNASVNGKKIPGPLFDFALLAFHNAHELFQNSAGPCFYLSKVEGANEAKLWNEIFAWSETRLGLPLGTVKACVLIENILSSYEMEHILYELRSHSLGLNCGIWDYVASIIGKFGHSERFVLPDRTKYVNMNQRFLKKYMQLLIRICHKRGALATGGMVARMLPIDCEETSDAYVAALQDVRRTKSPEIHEGIDGFLIYDLNLVKHVNALWRETTGPFANQLRYLGSKQVVTEEDLLALPAGGVTEEALKHNIVVALLFIFNWLNGKGHFVHNGYVEDSATAEISRAQVWQWIRHKLRLEDNQHVVTMKLVGNYAEDVLGQLSGQSDVGLEDREKLVTAFHLFLDIVSRRDFPEFITTVLNDEYAFQRIHAKL